MEKLTTLLNDVLEGFRKLHVLVLLIRIGPNEMETINKHGAYNTSAIAVLALLFLVSINLYSPSYNIGIVTSGVAAILSAVLIGLIGFFVNFAAPADEVFSDDTIEASARSRTDKWAIYFIINLILLYPTHFKTRGS
jgi:hypothetical protein